MMMQQLNIYNYKRKKWGKIHEFFPIGITATHKSHLFFLCNLNTHSLTSPSLFFQKYIIVKIFIQTYCRITNKMYRRSKLIHSLKKFTGFKFVFFVMVFFHIFDINFLKVNINHFFIYTLLFISLVLHDTPAEDNVLTLYFLLPSDQNSDVNGRFGSVSVF